MLVLVTYDVSTTTDEGRKRLRYVAKKCLSYGQRVQNSVFECNINWSEFLVLRDDLKRIIDLKEDSLRFYNLGNNYSTKVIHIGIKPSTDMQSELIV